MKSVHRDYDDALLEKARTWKFRPATQGGRPVNVYFILTVNFKVQ